MRRMCLLAAWVLVIGCRRGQPAQGPFERAGQGVDTAADKTGQALTTAAQKTGEGVSAAAHATGKAFGKAGDKLQSKDAPPAPANSAH